MVYVVLSAVVSVCVALFAVQNSSTVEVTFLLWTFTTSQAMVVISSLVSGIFITFCWGLKLKTQHFLKDRKQQELISNLEAEKKDLEEKLASFAHAQRRNVAAEAMKNASASDNYSAVPKFTPNK